MLSKLVGQCAKQGANSGRLRIGYFEQPLQLSIDLEQIQGLLNGSFRG